MHRWSVEDVSWQPNSHFIFPIVSFLRFPLYFLFSLTLFILSVSTSALLLTPLIAPWLPPISSKTVLFKLTSDLHVVNSVVTSQSLLNLPKAFSAVGHSLQLVETFLS